MDMSFLDNFDTFGKMCGYLEFHDLLCIRLVCKNIANYVKNTSWKHCVVPIKYYQTLKYLIANFKFMHINMIEFKEYGLRPTPPVNNFFTLLKQIKYLTISTEERWDCRGISQLQSLVKFELLGVPPYNRGYLEEFSQLSNLRTLICYDKYDIIIGLAEPLPSLDSFISYFSQITKLDIKKHNGKVTNTSLNKLTNLTTLKVNRETEFGALELTSLKKLQTETINFEETKYLTNLTHLSLQYFDRQMCPYLINFKSLIYLNVEVVKLNINWVEHYDINRLKKLPIEIIKADKN